MDSQDCGCGWNASLVHRWSKAGANATVRTSRVLQPLQSQLLSARFPPERAKSRLVEEDIFVANENLPQQSVADI